MNTTMSSDYHALSKLIKALQRPRVEALPVTAPLSDLPRLRAAGLQEGYDFRREPVGKEERFVARTTAAERWMVPQVPSADGRAGSRRFIPSREQAHRSALLAALYQMGASEAEVVEHLFQENEQRLADIMRLMEGMPLKASFPWKKP